MLRVTTLAALAALAGAALGGVAAAASSGGLTELPPTHLEDFGELHPVRADAIGGTRVLIQFSDSPWRWRPRAVAFVEVDLQTGRSRAFLPPAADLHVMGVEGGRLIGISGRCPIDWWAFQRVWVIDMTERTASVLFDFAETPSRWDKIGVADASLSADGSIAAVVLKQDPTQWDLDSSRRTLRLIDLRDEEHATVRTERRNRRDGHFQTEATEFILASDGSSLLAVSFEQHLAALSANPGITPCFEAISSVVIERVTIGERQLRHAATIEEAGFMLGSFRFSHSGSLVAMPAAFGAMAIADLTTGRVARTEDRLKSRRVYRFPGAWRPDSGTLLAVRTNPDEIIELAPDAEVLARWPTGGRAAQAVFWLPDSGPHAIFADGEIVRLGEDGSSEMVWVMPRADNALKGDG